MTARNLLLTERSRKPKIGGIHGGERGFPRMSVPGILRDHMVDGIQGRKSVELISAIYESVGFAS